VSIVTKNHHTPKEERKDERRYEEKSYSRKGDDIEYVPKERKQEKPEQKYIIHQFHHLKSRKISERL
jgi:hypothetical protein